MPLFDSQNLHGVSYNHTKVQLQGIHTLLAFICSGTHIHIFTPRYTCKHRETKISVLVQADYVFSLTLMRNHFSHLLGTLKEQKYYYFIDLTNLCRSTMQCNNLPQLAKSLYNYTTVSACYNAPITTYLIITIVLNIHSVSLSFSMGMYCLFVF